MAVGDSVPRIEAAAKVTGRARFAGDFTLPGMRIAKYLRSSIAHGRVTSIDVSKAKVLPGVDGVFTFADVPKIDFATAGHAYSLDPRARDVEDRMLLTDHIRYHGDEIAIVVAANDLIARQALELIEVEYQELPPILTAEQAYQIDAEDLHPGKGTTSVNECGAHEYVLGNVEQSLADADHLLNGRYTTQMVQHCHMETHVGYAYMDDLDYIVVVSSTQIPHICRRIVAQSLDMPLHQIRVIKPAIGGGFGNKQDVVLEPMLAFLTKKLGGLPVKIEMTREENMVATRVRHPFDVKIKAGVNNDGTLKGLSLDVLSNTGAYASHGHSICKAAGSKLAPLYPRTALRYNAKTFYSTLPAGGAMRGYGSPQIIFAVDNMMEQAAAKIGMDPVDFRIKNAAVAGDINPLSGKAIDSCGLIECLQKGRDILNWDQRRKELQQQTGRVRCGVGVACFAYGSGTYPAGVEIAGARMVLNQDGSANLHVGAVEIGQGSDTVFAQMAAERLGISVDMIRVVSTQDTDSTPFDPGAFASRQAYVASPAVAGAAEKLRKKILDHAALMLEKKAETLDIHQKDIIERTSGEKLLSLQDLSLDAYYHKERGGQITAEMSTKMTANAYAYGATFTEIEVDLDMCRIEIKKIWNIHDAGKIINPLLARGQVEGGVGMGIAGALAEEMLINAKNGKILNGNLLDYKMPTCLDLPDIDCDFVETDESTAPFGNKSLGEPPLLSVAPAIRNALLHATGVQVDSLPMSPKALFIHFRDAGLLG